MKFTRYLKPNLIRIPMPILLIILAIILPPVAVFLKSGAGKDLVINIILCLLFYIPGIIHALWLVTKK